MRSTHWTAAALAAAVAGCMPSRSDVFGPVAAGASARTGHDVSWRSPMMSDERIRAAVDDLLADGLELDDAVRIGLLDNRRLQAAFDELGIARGDLAIASVLRNPEIDARVRFARDSDPSIEIDAVQDILGLITIGRRRGVASAELESARVEAIGAVVDLVAEVRAGYYTAQAAEQQLEMRRTIFDATDASYTLAQRLHEAGNITDLELLRERDMYEQARIDLAGAESMRLQSREHVSAALGLWGDHTGWTISGRLDAPAADEIELDHFERVAVERSLDLEAERWRLRAAGGRVGLARLERWLPELGVGVAAERDGADGDWAVGPAVVLSIPLWDQNSGAIARRESELSRSQHRYGALAVEVRADARASRTRLLAARARALSYRDTVLPLRAEIVAETERARNAMAASSFELLSAKRRQIEAGAEYVDALLEYWLARAAAEQVLAGRRPGTARATPSSRGGANDSMKGGH